MDPTLSARVVALQARVETAILKAVRRHPAGSQKGGQFAPGGGAEGVAALAKVPALQTSRAMA